jgi:hypothetical protein
MVYAVLSAAGQERHALLSAVPLRRLSDLGQIGFDFPCLGNIVNMNGV